MHREVGSMFPSSGILAGSVPVLTYKYSRSSIVPIFWPRPGEISSFISWFSEHLSLEPEAET